MISRETGDFLSMLDSSHKVTDDEKKMVLGIDDFIDPKDSVKYLIMAVTYSCITTFVLGVVVGAAWFGRVNVTRAFLSIVVLVGLLSIVFYAEFHSNNKKLFFAMLVHMRFLYMLKWDMYKYDAEVDEALKVPTGKGISYYLALRFKDMNVVSSFIPVSCEYYYCDYNNFEWDLYTVIPPDSNPLFFVKRRESQVA